MRILTFTNLFPNLAEPARGLFNLQAFQALARECEELRVVAPVRIMPRAYRCGNPDVRVPGRETIGGLEVYHPRYVLVPKVAVSTQPHQLDLCVSAAMARIRREFPPDVLFGTWAFPDLVAAAAIARRWDIPLAAKVHGADINVGTRDRRRRGPILRALRQARIILSVTEALKERMVELGIPAEKILVQRNGVDCERFRIGLRAEARQALGMDPEGYHLLYIGTFRDTKGLDVLVEAVRRLVEAGLPVSLHLVGDGRLEQELRDQARTGGIAERVRFEGYHPHEAVPRWLAAADVLCLPSRSDGCPNIILESLACGRPVVASRVGGIPEILTEEAGVLVPPDDAGALAAGLRAALERDWDPEQLRASVLDRSWTGNAAEFYRALEVAVAPPGASPAGRQLPVTSSTSTGP